MADDFFLDDAPPKTFKKKRHMDSDSDDNDLDDMNLEPDMAESSEEEQETAAQKRLRLAKGYLSKVKEEVTDILPGEIDAAEIDKSLIAERLKADADEAAGRVFNQLAHTLDPIDLNSIKIFHCGKHAQLSLTGVAVSQSKSNLFIYGSTKDAALIKWDFSGERVHVFPGGLKPTKRLIKSVGQQKIAHSGHNDHILCIDASHDGKLIVSFKKDQKVERFSNLWRAVPFCKARVQQKSAS